MKHSRTCANPLVGRRWRRTAGAGGCVLGQFSEAEPEAEPEHAGREWSGSRWFLGKLCDPGRYSQDQARHRHPAGKPFVRHLFRHLSRCRRHPDAKRQTDGLCHRPGHQDLRGTVRRPRGREWRWAALRQERDRRYQRRQDGRIHRPGTIRAQGCLDPTDPACTNSAVPDVMGYHTQSDIPNYWAYANNFVLQDHMFEPNASWSLPVPPVPGLRVVRGLHPARQSVQLSKCPANQEAGSATGRTGVRRRTPKTSRYTRGPISPTCSTSQR